MNEVIRGRWAGVVCNDNFVCIETYSGYRGGQFGDPKGKQHLLVPDASDEELGLALLDAMSHSRFVLAAPREGSMYPPDLEFDRDLYDYRLTAERYAAWTKALMDRYGYKTKRAMFKGMKNCNVTSKAGVLTIGPSHHEKLEAWERTKDDGIKDVVIPAHSSPTEIGAALRLAFSRCTE